MRRSLSFAGSFPTPLGWMAVAAAILATPFEVFAQSSSTSKNVAIAKDHTRQKWAVLVGVNKYNELRSLVYCHEDVQVLGQRLIQAGFPAANVFLLTSDAKEMKYLPFKGNIERQLELVTTMAGEEDLVLVAFSGHGTHLDGASYFCPAEARVEDPKRTMVPLDFVYQRLAQCKARWKLLLVDACRNDPRPLGMKDAGTSKSAGDFAKSLEKPPQGILALTSCAPGEMSMESDDLRHGVFMNFLLEGLSGKADRDGGNGDGQVSLLELYRYTNVQTKRYVARQFNHGQTPTLRGEIPEDYEITSATTDPAVLVAMAEGDEHFANNHYDRAIVAYTRAIQLDPKCILAYDGRGQARRRQNDFAGAILDHTLAIQLGPQAVSLARRAMAYVAAKETDKASADADEAIRLDRSCAEAHGSRGAVLEKKGLASEAIAEFGEAIRLDPKHALTYVNRGYTHANQKEYAKAIADYDEAIRLEPKLAMAYNNRGGAYGSQKDYAKAIADFDEAIHLDPKLARAYCGRGWIHERRNERAKAIADYDEAIRLDPKYAMAYNSRGSAYRDEKQYAKAMADFDEAIRLDPKLGRAYGNRGVIYGSRGEYAKAMADFDEAIRLDPKNAMAYMNRGNARRLQKQLAEAVEDFNTAITLGLESPLPFLNRGGVYLDYGQHDWALADFNEAIRRNPKLHQAYSSRARAYRAKGMTAEADADEQKANELKQQGANQ